ncbi:MAG: hypothetical protein A2452_05895 [Candidatus Firestonebacteria bacterium RIFOXYC2_FULL_39_67]|nr:MAG: hypothetical protein A2536_12570 [Candidatus Firestonebacteria bacterium RIFOXYD2_FULL_39_29]OGF56621.1 MAG: hypothetical protein A2452_05895 [Candidatus Firestonebacteria bacterium RIFOXYC2_FULL_39_67]
MKKIIRSLTLMCLFFSLGVVYSEELTVKALGEEFFPKEKIITCDSCLTKNSSFNRYCVNCGTALNQEDISAYFMIKAGSFIPGDSAMRDAFGTPLSVGFAVNLEKRSIGLRLDVETIWMERLVPVTSSETTTSAPGDGEWMNAFTRYLFTPVTLSLYITENIQNWKGYFGIGAGLCMVRKETRGSYYVLSELKWGYANDISNDNLPVYQIFAGVVKNNKIGLDLKYTFIPSYSRYPYPYIGGLSTTVSLLF